MKRFLTKYDIKHFNGVEMNPYDAVDRLSYVDSTTQIVRMLKAGVSMKLRRSQLIGSEDDMNCPAMPVYAPDIADAYRQLHEMQDRLKENQRLQTEALEKARLEALNKQIEYQKKLLDAQNQQQNVSPERGVINDLPSST